jgi:outer membrane biosynthesis protein TonB
MGSASLPRKEEINLIRLLNSCEKLIASLEQQKDVGGEIQGLPLSEVEVRQRLQKFAFVLEKQLATLVQMVEEKECENNNNNNNNNQTDKTSTSTYFQDNYFTGNKTSSGVQIIRKLPPKETLVAYAKRIRAIYNFAHKVEGNSEKELRKKLFELPPTSKNSVRPTIPSIQKQNKNIQTNNNNKTENEKDNENVNNNNDTNTTIEKENDLEKENEMEKDKKNEKEKEKKERDKEIHKKDKGKEKLEDYRDENFATTKPLRSPQISPVPSPTSGGSSTSTSTSTSSNFSNSSTFSSSSSSVRKRKSNLSLLGLEAEAMRLEQEGPDMSADQIIDEHSRLHDNLTEDMLNMAAQLKANSLNFGNLLAKDNAKLDLLDTQAEANLGKIKIENQNLKKDYWSSWSQTLTTWIAIVFVAIIFVWMILFIRLFPRA